MNFMLLTATIASVLWLLFVVVWIVSAFRAKRTVKRNHSMFIWRVLIVLVIVLLIKYEKVSVVGALLPSQNLALAIFGLALMVMGIGIAFWARFHLSSNWGMPMSLKENTELVTTGPYAYIRNPIYSGVVLTMVGSGFTLGEWWFLIALVSLLYFIYASVQEEKIMMAAFPDTYSAYKARTKMLVPWVL